MSNLDEKRDQKGVRGKKKRGTRTRNGLGKGEGFGKKT